MRLAILASALLVAAPAVAKEVTIKLTDDELRVQMSMNEIALKATGDAAADAYIALRAKYKAAVEEANKPVEPKKDTPDAKPAQ
jgi:ElaB/YqjD/DUF883 family membrane-anchored ribosome-binding protein